MDDNKIIDETQPDEEEEIEGGAPIAPGVDEEEVVEEEI